MSDMTLKSDTFSSVSVSDVMYTLCGDDFSINPLSLSVTPGT